MAEDQGVATPLVLWDTALGRKHAEILGAPGTRFCRCYFSPDGNRLVAACDDSKVRLYDWRIGEEPVALSDTTVTPQFSPLAVSADGLRIAYGGDSPSLRVARALPCNSVTLRDGAFYRAVDDLRAYTARTIWRGESGTISAVFTNLSDQTIDVTVLFPQGDQHRQKLAVGDQIREPGIRSDLEFLFSDPGSGRLLESIATTEVGTRDGEGPVGISLSLPGKLDLGRCRNCRERGSNVRMQLALAIAHHLAGHRGDARAWLDKALAALKEVYEVSANPRIENEVTRWEAERLILGNDSR